MLETVYLDRNTFIHQLDPRTKIIGMVLLSILPFVFNDPIYVGMVAFSFLGLGALAQALDNFYRARYLMFIFLVVGFIVWQFYLDDGSVVAHIGSVSLFRESLLYGLAMGLRYTSVLMLGMLLVSVIKIEELMLGLTKLGVPYTIAFIFSLTARLIPAFAYAFSTILQAQIARGLDLETRNPYKRVARLMPVMVPFLIYTIRYATLLSMALEAKGFSPGIKRTYFLELRMTVWDYLVLINLITIILGTVTLRFYGYGAVIPGRI